MTELPQVDDPPRSYRLEIITHAGWISANDRTHWGVRHRLTAHYRNLANLMCRAHKIPPIEKARIVCELRFGDRRRRDPANFGPTAKAVIDGMVDAGVFADDDHTHVVGPDMRIGEVSKRPMMIVHVWPVNP